MKSSVNYIGISQHPQWVLFPILIFTRIQRITLCQSDPLTCMCEHPCFGLATSLPQRCLTGLAACSSHGPRLGCRVRWSLLDSRLFLFWNNPTIAFRDQSVRTDLFSFPLQEKVGHGASETDPEWSMRAPLRVQRRRSWYARFFVFFSFWFHFRTRNLIPNGMPNPDNITE